MKWEEQMKDGRKIKTKETSIFRQRVSGESSEWVFVTEIKVDGGREWVVASYGLTDTEEDAERKLTIATNNMIRDLSELLSTSHGACRKCGFKANSKRCHEAHP